jgi:Na+-transporting methylmalonyl-CoA/oxaloacetate decarboxylase gamma subunit
MNHNNHLPAVLGLLVVFLFLVALISFTQDVLAVGSCGVGPAAPGPTECMER